MKKVMAACAVAIMLAACSSKERTGLRETLVEKFKDDQDLKDYNLDPVVVADCVVNEIAASLPGFAGDPRRDRFFDAYARFIGVNSPGEAEKAIKEFTELFGSARQAREAAANLSNHMMTCMGAAIATSEDEETHHPASAKGSNPSPEVAPEAGTSAGGSAASKDERTEAAPNSEK